jgi:hypothetical protein
VAHDNTPGASISFEEACFLAGVSDDVLKTWLEEGRVASRRDVNGMLRICVSTLARTALEEMRRKEKDRKK